MTQENAGPPETNAQVLERLLAGLQSADTVRQAEALDELRKLRFSSTMILREIETLALSKTKEIRQSALETLDTQAHKYIRSQITKLGFNERQKLLSEIKEWLAQGLIQPAAAEVITRRYNFDMPGAAPARTASAPAVPSPAAPPMPAGPRPSLVQVLLSETSVKVALYLGAFFVIAAAAILAALVEAARLPILISVTLGFLITSVALKQRLPQPSFVLFVVFSFLLPINAGVISESMHLSEAGQNIYWAVVFLMMTIIWGASTWFFDSRLFSLAAFAAFTLALLRLSALINGEPELSHLMLALACLAGLGEAQVLKAWKTARFAMPLFILAQILMAGLLFGSTLSALERVLQLPDGPSASGLGWWAVAALTWLIACSFYVWSNALIRFALLPWAAAATLLPLPWMLLNAFDASATWIVAGIWVWAAILALASEKPIAIGKLRAYSLPLLTGASLLFFIAALWGFIENNLIAFEVLLGTAAVFTVLAILRPRGLVWAAGLVAGLAAYFTFFELPFMAGIGILPAYELLIAGLLLLAADLVLKPDWSAEQAWRLPPRLLGASVVALNMLWMLVDNQKSAAAIGFGAYALFFAAYAVRYRAARIGYIATASAALAALFALQQLRLDAWLPTLTGLAVFYYLAGFSLRGRSPAWSEVLRRSGLLLGGLLSLVTLLTLKETGGWYAAIAGLLFLIEMFAKPAGPLELAALGLFSISVFLFSRDIQVREFTYVLLALSLVWLGGDLLFQRAFKERKLAGPVRLIGAVLCGINVLSLLLSTGRPTPAMIGFSVYALFFAVDAWLYRQPVIGYAATTSLPLAVFFALRTDGRPGWLLPFAGLAVVYYAAGAYLRRRGEARGWSQMLVFSGLGLGTLNSFSAPLQGGLQAALPVAVGATLFAVEAFSRRNVWLGFPANALYLMAYFIILDQLKVDQPQFYTVAIAALGLLMHYLLVRAGSRTGAFLTGLFSQLVLLGTTYVQLIDTGRLSFFVVIFFQALAVLIYGLVVRSRSLVITPIIFVVLAVVSVVYSALKGISTVVLIGCTGLILLMLGILAVVMRERITKMGERLGDWNA